MTRSCAVRVDEASAVGEAKRRAAGIARVLSFDATAAGRVQIVVAELASNLVKHGGGGVMLLGAVEGPDGPGIDALALDRGPGMRDLAASLRDGYSTAGSQGTGLGAVRRLSSVFDVYAPPGAGTAVLGRIAPGPPAQAAPPRPLTVGAVSVPVDGETVCGDAWAAHQVAGRTTLLVADGLGHGPGAHEAAQLAVSTFLQHPGRPPDEQVAALDAALRTTRGAAVAVAEVLPDEGVVRYSGLGNIAARVHGGEKARSLVSREGTAGVRGGRYRQTTAPWPGDAMLLVHSDGLSPRWSLDDYPGLHRRHPALIAGVLFRDHRRERDDATVVVAVPRRTPQ